MAKTRIINYTRVALPRKAWHRAFSRLTDVILPRMHNTALEANEARYRERGRRMSFYVMTGTFLTGLRAANPELREYSRDIFNGLFKRIDWALGAFDRGLKGKPRFKGPKRTIKSFDLYAASGSFHIRRSGKKHPLSNEKTYGKKWGVYIKGLGFCAFKGDPPPGKIKTLTVKRTAMRIEFKFGVEEQVPERADASDKPIVGIDLGQTDMIVTSTGERIPGRTRDTRRVKALQAKLAGQVKGSGGYRKTQRLIAKECQRVAEREDGFFHETTTDLVKRHGPNLALENLNVNGLISRENRKGRHSRRKNREQCWGKTTRMLTHKAEGAGGGVTFVDPAYTTQDCAACGNRTKMPIGARQYDCGECGFSLDRDENAAINVAARAVKENAGRTCATGAPAGLACIAVNAHAKKAIHKSSGGALQGVALVATPVHGSAGNG